MSKKRHTTLLMTQEDQARLEYIARKLGYLQTRGPGAGQLGSISALVCAVARGHLDVVPCEGEDSTNRSEATIVTNTDKLAEGK